METTMKITATVIAILTVAILSNPTNAIAVTQTPEDISTKITPINQEISLEVTTTDMYVPEENMLPWGVVRGNISDPVDNYPVIIQFFEKDNLFDEVDKDDLVHIAQVDVKGDDTYEYKFRVLNKDLKTGKIINIFEGEYVVKIFKVIHNDIQTL